MVGAGAAALSANPAMAAGIISAVTTVSCLVTGSNWCVSGNNTSSGIGVIGTSKTGTGLRGTSSSQYGLKATSVSGTAILAQTTSGSTGISALAEAANGFGVSGQGGGYGVYGRSVSGVGVYGENDRSGTGVLGIGASNGTGVSAESVNGPGLYAQSNGGHAVNAINAAGTATVLATNGGSGSAGEFIGGSIGLISRAASSSYLIYGTDLAGNQQFWVRGNGDVALRGELLRFSAAAGGASVKSFSPNSAQPTVEDSGTAQLSSGVAAIRLDPTFAASIDFASGYRVFLTPNGDTRGLFVAAKTANGFIVRESQGGRSTVSFDYRILATPLGHAGQRMAVMPNAATELPAARASARAMIEPLTVVLPPAP